MRVVQPGLEDVMAFPTISVSDREIVLLNGFELAHGAEPAEQGDVTSTHPGVVILDEVELLRSIRNDNDAVAFGYLAGRWVSAA